MLSNFQQNLISITADHLHTFMQIVSVRHTFDVAHEQITEHILDMVARLKCGHAHLPSTDTVIIESHKFIDIFIAAAEVFLHTIHNVSSHWMQIEFMIQRYTHAL